MLLKLVMTGLEFQAFHEQFLLSGLGPITLLVYVNQLGPQQGVGTSCLGFQELLVFVLQFSFEIRTTIDQYISGAGRIPTG